MPASSGEVTTRARDHMSGQIVGLDCHGLHFVFLGNHMVVPLDRLASASSAGDVAVQPGSGNDKVTGRLEVNGGVAYVTTRDEGRVSIPFAALTCVAADPDKASPGATAPSAPTTAGNLARGYLASGSPPPRATLRPLSDAEMAALTGTGPTPSDVPAEPSPTTSGSGQPNASTNSQTGQPNASTDSQTGQPNTSAQSTTSTDNKADQPDAKISPATAEEQQQETEREALEFLRNEAVLLQPHKIEGDFGLSYLHTTQTIGNEKVVGGTATVRYGVLANLEVFLGLPFVWGQRQTFEFGGTTINDELAGLGDIRFGAKYNVLNERPGRPAVVLGATVTAPTGRQPYLQPTSLSGAPVIGDIRSPLAIQIGAGHWQVTGSATAFKSYDPVVLYTTLNYTHFFPQTYYGVFIEPGDVFELNAGLGVGVNDTDTVSAAVIVDYEGKWQFNHSPIAQTSITPINLKLAYLHVLSPSDMLQPSILVGATRDANDAVVALDWIHRF